MPAKSSSPGTGGIDGRPSCPQAEISTSVSCVLPSPRVSVQRHDPSSNLAAATSVPNRMCRSTPNRSAQSCRYARISSCGGNFRVQSVFGAKEKEYRWAGTSHSAPGYVFACQTPPASSLFSSSVRSPKPACRSRIAIPMPPNPVPMIVMAGDRKVLAMADLRIASLVVRPQ